MEPQYFERVFLVFQRLYTRKDYQGTGIGAGDLQESRRALRRMNLGRVGTRRGHELLLHHPGKEEGRMNNSFADRPVVILMAEDNPTDVLIAREKASATRRC